MNLVPADREVADERICRERQAWILSAGNRVSRNSPLSPIRRGCPPAGGSQEQDPPFALVTEWGEISFACLYADAVAGQAGARGFQPCASGHRWLCWSTRIRTCCARTCDTIVSCASSISFIVVGKNALPRFRSPSASAGGADPTASRWTDSAGTRLRRPSRRRRESTSWHHRSGWRSAYHRRR